jgi:DNA-3-methyladenine glycosylase
MPDMKQLPQSFFLRDQVQVIAQELLGKIVLTNFNNKLTAVRIVETEAYAGITDRASHAWNGRRTARTNSMYLQGGICYVYLCYGIHYLLNFITNQAGVPHAVLIRAGIPIIGEEQMWNRYGYKVNTANLYKVTKGPGNLAKALGINIVHNAATLENGYIWVADDGYTFPAEQIVAGPRVGVQYAGQDALLPYRYFIKGCKYVS